MTNRQIDKQLTSQVRIGREIHYGLKIIAAEDRITIKTLIEDSLSKNHGERLRTIIDNLEKTKETFREESSDDEKITELKRRGRELMDKMGRIKRNTDEHARISKELFSIREELLRKGVIPFFVSPLQ